MSEAPPPPPVHNDSPKLVADSSIFTGLYINAALGTFFLLCFCFLQATSSKLYRLRQVSESVTVKPPKVPTTGFHKYW
jgi:hypothetical protein